MYLRTRALDCLYLNWALPKSAAPELPPGLAYEVHPWRGSDYVFVSALLFRLSGMRLESLPFVRLSYPQMNCRVYVLDADTEPSVLFRRTLVPTWVVPVSRVLGRQPASAARFSYPRASSGNEEDAVRTWKIQRRRRLEVTARLSSPRLGPGPQLGTWAETVEYFRRRQRSYVVRGGRLSATASSRVSVEALPLEVEVRRAGLVAECFGNVSPELWRTPHSAWLCPEIPFLFELAELRAPSLARGRVAAAEGC